MTHVRLQVFPGLTNHALILLGLMQSPLSAASLSLWFSSQHAVGAVFRSVHIRRRSGCTGER